MSHIVSYRLLIAQKLPLRSYAFQSKRTEKQLNNFNIQSNPPVIRQKYFVKPNGDTALRKNATTTITEKISYTNKNYKQDAYKV